MLLDQWAQGLGVEAAEDGAELAECAEQSDHARVAKAEPGSPLTGLAGGHDQGLEDAGGGCRSAALALHLQQGGD
jgi:hypothetical protein